MTKFEIGKKRIQEVLGVNADDIMKSFETVSPDFANYVIEFVYGDFYARQGLTDKERELAVVANLIGQGNTGFPLKTHIKGMLNVGWNKKEIIELIIFLVVYSGFPSCVDAIKIAQELFEKQ